MSSLLSCRIASRYLYRTLRNDKIHLIVKTRKHASVLQKVPKKIYNLQCCSLSSQAEAEVKEENSNVIQDEKLTGTSEKLEFQAETRMLLDIVAKSLYSEKEVFIRELISNASDALEKLRYVSITENPNDDLGPMEIRISTDKQNRIITIQDTGIGMTKEELISNLGTIARSGSKAFLEELKEKSADTSSIIGQFGVGFYSCFMVANKVEVYTKSKNSDGKGYCWTSDGYGSYEIQEAENVSRGTKIIIHLKPDCREYSDADTVKNVIKKYSNFVNSPIYVNSEKANTIQPLWVVDPKSVKKEEHNEFYRFISNSYDKPRFVLHYVTDAPIAIKALLYIPESKPVLYQINEESAVSLYARRVLIKNKAEDILPKWCRFIKGVVDSEDIPLNLSRELLQNSPLITKLRNVLTNRVIKFLLERSQKEPEEYDRFYKDYNIYIKSGVMFASTTEEKAEVAKLLRYETSKTAAGVTISVDEYIKKMQNDQKDIFYLSAPSRALAESSPYYESLKRANIEVLFCYEPFDEHVLLQLRTYNNKNIVSAEKRLRDDNDKTDADIISDPGTEGLAKGEIDSLISWTEKQLKDKAYSVKVTNKLENHPCAITVEEMGAARQFLKSQVNQFDEKTRYSILQPRLEINPKHPIIKKLNGLIDTNPDLASLLVQQLFTNAMLVAGLIEDPRTILSNMNDLLNLALEKK